MLTSTLNCLIIHVHYLFGRLFLCLKKKIINFHYKLAYKDHAAMLDIISKLFWTTTKTKVKYTHKEKTEALNYIYV